MASRVAITGGTGFIGAAVVADLVSSGTQVTVLVRPNSDLTRLSAAKGIDIITYSGLQDEPTVAGLKLRSPDVFIHCGWRGVGGTDRNNAFQVTDNIPLTLDSVELAARVGCRKWVGIGSQAEYGNQNCRMDENAMLRPTTTYGKAKLAAGVAALALCDARNMASAWLRVFSTYGPGDSPQWFIPYVMQELLAGRAPRLTKCEQLWDYLYVTDASRAIIAVAAGDANGVYNLGGGFARPLREYIEAIRSELCDAPQPIYGAIPYRPDQVMHLEADITRLQTATGWRARVPLSEGIRATLSYERARCLLGAK